MFSSITRLQSMALAKFQCRTVVIVSAVLCIYSTKASALVNECSSHCVVSNRSLYSLSINSSCSDVFICLSTKESQQASYVTPITHQNKVKHRYYEASLNYQYRGERIAISADGNNQADNHVEARWPRADEDDWAGTAATLAILAKKGLQDKLVHYSYNNFIGAPAHTSERNYMADSVNGAIEQWNFHESQFFDASEDTGRAIEHLAHELAKSSKHDPLYFIHMGPSEFLYQAVVRVIDMEKVASLSHVYVVSHSGYNDNHLRRKAHHTMAEVLLRSGNRIHYKRIKDQNGCDKPTILWCSKTFQPFEWLKTHEDPSLRWLWERMQQNPKNKADLSDAGMVFFLIEGDEHGSPKKFSRFLGNSVMPK